jgi:hypothetical protein
MDRDLRATAFGPIFGSIGVVGGVLEGDPLLLRGRHRAAVAGPESPAQTALSPRIPCVAPPMPGTPILHFLGHDRRSSYTPRLVPLHIHPIARKVNSPTLRQSRAVATFLYLPTERAWPESALRALRICPRMGRSAATASSLS